MPLYPVRAGFRVFTVPEAATMLWTNGVALPDIISNEDTRYWFQHTILTYAPHGS
jgi:hypothetical protein